MITELRYIHSETNSSSPDIDIKNRPDSHNPNRKGLGLKHSNRDLSHSESNIHICSGFVDLKASNFFVKHKKSSLPSTSVGSSK